MSKNTLQLDFTSDCEPEDSFLLYENIIHDRGSKYSVSIGKVANREDIRDFLTHLKKTKKYAKATHNSWAARITKDGIVYETKSDDGEKGAGLVILKILQKKCVSNCVVCVTRWFGGVKLMGDRFKHVQDAAKYAVENISD